MPRRRKQLGRSVGGLCGLPGTELLLEVRWPDPRLSPGVRPAAPRRPPLPAPSEPPHAPPHPSSAVSTRLCHLLRPLSLSLFCLFCGGPGGSCSVFSGASTSSSLIKMCSLCLRPFPCPAHTVAALAAAAPGATRTAAHAPARAAAASPALAVAAVAAVAAAAAPKTLCLAAKVDRLRHKSSAVPAMERHRLLRSKSGM
jgi:predicted lipid-binding transport protein (Tim44 family)